MSKATPTSKSPAAKRVRRRVNLRAVVILLAVVVAAAPALIGVRLIVQNRTRRNYLREAKAQYAANKLPQALGFLNRYLELGGEGADSLEALDLKARILAESATDDGQVRNAILLHSKVLSLDENRLETRRRLVELNLKPGSRGVNAVEQAEKLVAKLRDRKAPDPEATKLLAFAYLRATFQEQNDAEARALMVKAKAAADEFDSVSPGDVELARSVVEVDIRRFGDNADATDRLNKLDRQTVGDPKKHAVALLMRALHYAKLAADDEISPAQAQNYAAYAQKDLDDAQKSDPLNPDVRLEQAIFALRRNQIDAAREHLAAMTPDARKSPNSIRVEAEIAMRDGRPQEAVRILQEGLKQSGGNDRELTFLLASFDLDLGRVEDARLLARHYEQVAGETEPSARFLYLLGRIDLVDKEYEKAINKLLLATTRIERGAKLEESRRREMQEQLRQEREENRRYEPSIYYFLGEAYEQQHKPGDDVRAMEAYTKSSELAGADNGVGKWTLPYLAMARLYDAAKRGDEAVQSLRRALVQVPGDPRATVALAGRLFKEQQAKPANQRSYAEVEKLLAEAEKANPGSPLLALLRADYLNNTGRFDDALELLRAACQQNPRIPDLWVAQINALYSRKYYARALAAVDEALAKAGPHPSFYVTKSSVLAAKGDVQGCKATLQDGLKALPEEQKPPVLRILGSLLASLREYAEARKVYQQWATILPNDIEPQVAMTEVAFAMEDSAAIDRSVRWLESKGNDRDNVIAKVILCEQAMRPPGGAKPDPARLEKARDYAQQVAAKNPLLGRMLIGRVEEKLGRPGPAIEQFRLALAEPGGTAALKPLVELLVREGREAELEQLRKDFPTYAVPIGQTAAVVEYQLGRKDRAQQLAEMAVQGNPNGVDVRIWQADVLRALGKDDDAERELAALAARKPEEPALWLKLLMLQVSRNKMAEANATVEQIRQKVKSEYPELLWAQCYRVVNNLRRAAECYAQALQRWPDDPAVTASAVTFFEQVGLRDVAEQRLRKALATDPSNAWARRELAQSLAGHVGDRKAWQEALALVGPEARPEDVAEDRLARARVYIQALSEADRSKGDAILDGLVKDFPNQASVQELVARRLYARSKAAQGEEAARLMAEAGKHAEVAARGDTADVNSVLFYAGVLMDLKDVPGAEAQLTRLLKVDPSSLPVAELKSKILTAKGDVKGAAEVLEKAFDERSKGSDALYVGEKTVTLLRQMGQNEAAERVARRTAETGSKGHIVLAETLAEKGDVSGALVELDAVAKDDPVASGSAALVRALKPKADPRWLERASRDLEAAAKAKKPAPEVLERLALVRHFRKEFQAEVDAYNALRALDPPVPLFLNNMAWTLCEALKQPEEAMKIADEALTRIGRRPELLDTRGVIHTRLGRYPQAVQELEEAAAAAPSGSTFFHLARAYQKLGQADKAKEARERARQANLSRDQLELADQTEWDAVMTP